MSRSFVERVQGASLLDADTYEEVEADRGATLQAASVVLLSSVAAGIGSIDNTGLGGVLAFIGASLAGWPLTIR